MNTVQLPINLPVIYNLHEATSTAIKTFRNSVQAFRDVLYLVFCSEGIKLPKELNRIDGFFSVYLLNSETNAQQFFLTTGENKKKTRFKCIINEKTEMICSVQICETPKQGLKDAQWKDVLYRLDYFPISEFEAYLPKIIKSMKTGEVC